MHARTRHAPYQYMHHATVSMTARRRAAPRTLLHAVCTYPNSGFDCIRCCAPPAFRDETLPQKRAGSDRGAGHGQDHDTRYPASEVARSLSRSATRSENELRPARDPGPITSCRAARFDLPPAGRREQRIDCGGQGQQLASTRVRRRWRAARGAGMHVHTRGRRSPRKYHGSVGSRWNSGFVRPSNVVHAALAPRRWRFSPVM